MSEMIDFQPYLRSIRDTYHQRNRLYTPTDAEFERSPETPINFRNAIGGDDPLLLFEQMAEIVPSRKQADEHGDDRNLESREKKVEKIPVLQGLREYAQARVLLVGQPGLGKSTTLQRFLWEEARSALESQHPHWIPILVELRYCQGSPFDRLRAVLQHHDRALHLGDADLKRELRQGRFLLLFDGLNELPSEEARQQIRQFCSDYPGCPLVGTTRDLSLGGSFGIEKQLEMLPLDDRQMQQFVRAYLPEEAEAMLRALQARSRVVGRTRFEQTPLLLMMLCGVFRKTGEIPANLGLLFREFAKLHQGKLKEGVPASDRSRHWWQPLLTHLGEYMMQSDKLTEFRVALPKTLLRAEFERWLQGRVEAPGDRAAECLDDLLEHSLLQVQAGDNIEFLHQLIQEYYAAEALLEQLPDLSDGELKREYLNYLKWTEPVALMLALVGDEAQAVRVVRLALEVDWMLGARLAGEVKRGFQEKTVGMVSELDVPLWLKVELWGKTRSDFALPGLIQALEDEHPSVRARAVEALGKLGAEAAIFHLIERLQDRDFDVRLNAVEALELLGAEVAIPSGIKKLQDGVFLVSSSAVEVLGDLGTDASPPWIERLQDERSWMFRIVVLALGKIGGEKAVSVLTRIFEFRGAKMWKQLSLLTQILAVGLVKSLNNRNVFVRHAVAETLSKTGSPKVLPNLRQRLREAKYPEIAQVITSIQANCKFYNYDIFRSSPVPPKHQESKAGNLSQPTTNIYNIDTLNAPNSPLNLGGTIHGNQTSTQNPKPEP